jgi:hypothetical protein
LVYDGWYNGWFMMVGINGWYNGWYMMVNGWYIMVGIMAGI